MSWLAKPSRSTERGRSCRRHEPSAVPVLGQHDLLLVEASPLARSASASPAVEAVAAREQHRVGHDARGTWPRDARRGSPALHDVRIGIVNDAPARRRAWFLRSLLLASLPWAPDMSKAVKQLLRGAPFRRAGEAAFRDPAKPEGRAAVYAIQDGVARGHRPGRRAGRSVRARRPPIPTRRRCWPARWCTSPATFDGKAMHMIGVEIEISFHIAQGHRRARHAGRPRRGARCSGRRLRRHGSGRHPARRFQVGGSRMAAGRQPDEPGAGGRRYRSGTGAKLDWATLAGEAQIDGKVEVDADAAGWAPSIRCARSPG